ncbi:MAG TPA: hypothetical protein VGU63_12980 [Candidatus Acidoferrales bacterium]|nr:hypothetical protein [Candidatus Acidoferrales bacterium]
MPWLCADDDKAEEAREQAQRNAGNYLDPPELPPAPRSCHAAAKAKVAERIASVPGFERHSRKCQICRSPYVDFIEDKYLRWYRCDLVCRFYRIGDTDTLYRHVRAAGLDTLRRQNIGVVVENFIEQWPSVKVSASNILHSIRALSCLDDKGQWTDPPRTHILVRGQNLADTRACSSDSGLPDSGLPNSGLPNSGATSTTEPHEARPRASASSTQQCGRHDENSSADSDPSLATSDSSLASHADRA